MNVLSGGGSSQSCPTCCNIKGNFFMALVFFMATFMAVFIMAAFMLLFFIVFFMAVFITAAFPLFMFIAIPRFGC
jgi:hypothetical protein